MTNETAIARYGCGSAKGQFVYDDIRLGFDDANPNNTILIKNYKFGIMTE